MGHLVTAARERSCVASGKGTRLQSWRWRCDLSGSPDLYRRPPSGRGGPITFITAHDGFTWPICQLQRQTQPANGEDNATATNHNNSWEFRGEAPATNHPSPPCATASKRNSWPPCCSPGGPSGLMGDEVRRSQGGNNNTWCQNNPSVGCLAPDGGGFCPCVSSCEKAALVLPPQNSPPAQTGGSPTCKASRPTHSLPPTLCASGTASKGNAPNWGSWSQHPGLWSLHSASAERCSGAA